MYNSCWYPYAETVNSYFTVWPQQYFIAPWQANPQTLHYEPYITPAFEQ
jgi:hypothetical protein